MKSLALFFAPAAVVCLAQTPAPKPTTWEQFLQQLRSDTAWTPPFILVQPPDQKFIQTDEQLLRLIADGDLQSDQVPESTWSDLQARKPGKANTRWVLLQRSGLEIGEGLETPEASSILASLRDSGFVPTWERRKAFLQEHPGNGEAWVEELRFGLRLAALRFEAWTGKNPTLSNLRGDPRALAELRAAIGERQAAALVPEGLEALRRLADIPGWGGEGGMNLRTAAFLEGDSRIRQAAAVLELDAWAQAESFDSDHPWTDPIFAWYTWVNLARLAGTDLLSRLGGYREVPGQSGRLKSVLPLRSALRQNDPAYLARILEVVLDTAGQEPSVTGWEWLRSDLAFGHLVLAETLLRCGRPDAAAAALESARGYAGSRWPHTKNIGDNLFSASPAVSVPANLRAILDAPARPDPPAPPSPSHLQLAVLNPALAPAMMGLPAVGPLAPWSAQEFSVAVVPAARAADLQRKIGGHPRPQWVLLKGDDILASGMTPPDPKDLALKMESAAPSRLQRLSRFISRHPDHLGGRKARLQELLARMPDSRLEALLVEDSLACLFPPIPRPENWKPDPQLWQWAAGKVLPAVERQLESWPSRTVLWTRWLGWAELHPTPPSTLGLLSQVHVWSRKANDPMNLPIEVHAAVALEFRRQGRFEEMRAWFHRAWEAQDRSSWQSVLAGTADIDNRQNERKLRQQARQAIVLPLREALVVLRRDAEVVALDREVASWLGEEGRNP